MKTLKNILPISLLILAVLMIGSSCGDPIPDTNECEDGIHYKLDGNLMSFSNVTAEIHNDAVIGKFYDIWTDDNGGFYYHSTITETGEHAPYASDWFTTEDVGNIIFLNNKENVQVTFTIDDGANAVGEHVEISFSGSYVESGTTHQITEGKICTSIAIVN